MNPETLDWFFKAIMSGIGALAVYILSELLKSIAELNLKMAVIVTKIEGHDERISRLEDK